MNEFSSIDVQIAQLTRSLAVLRRTVVCLVVTLTLTLLAGAAAVTPFEGDVLVKGVLTARSATVSDTITTKALTVKDALQANKGFTVNNFDVIKALADLGKRNVVEQMEIPMGAFGSNDLKTWDYEFPAEVLQVSGSVQTADGASKPFIGAAQPETHGVISQRLPNGNLKVRVMFRPHWPNHPFAFVGVVVKKGS